MITPDNRLLTPLWLNEDLKIPIKKTWKQKGVYIVNDVLDRNRNTMSLMEFQNTFNIKTNFLEYGSFCLKFQTT